MKTNFFKDSLAAASAKLIAACLPFLTIGMLGSEITAVVSCIVALVAAVILLVRVVMLLGKTEAKIIPLLDEDVSDILSFPYAIAISSMIAIQAGNDAVLGLWFALGLAVIIIISNHLPVKHND